MRINLATLCIATIAASTIQSAFADETWFVKYDTNNDNRWTLQDFVNANMDYYRLHQAEKALNEAQLRAEFDSLSATHPGYVTVEQVKTIHNWGAL